MFKANLVKFAFTLALGLTLGLSAKAEVNLITSLKLAQKELAAINQISQKHVADKHSFTKKEISDIQSKLNTLQNTWVKAAPTTLKQLNSRSAQLIKNQFIKGDVSTFMIKKISEMNKALINHKPAALTQTTYELSESATKLLSIAE